MEERLLGRIILTALLFLCIQVPGYSELKYYDASLFTITGKALKTINPWHRMDVEDYPALTKGEITMIEKPANICVLFETDSDYIWVRPQFGKIGKPLNMPIIAYCGFSLYIEQDGRWMWAGAAGSREGKDKDGSSLLTKPVCLLGHGGNGMKKCMLCLPLYAELTNLEIGITEGCDIHKIPNPFEHKIVFYGSSFIHGSGASNPGMTIPGYLQRMSGWEICSFGVGGQAKMQDGMLDALCDTKAEAFICDVFSNPSDQTIRARFEPFIKGLRKSCKKTPIILISTRHRETRYFNQLNREREEAKLAVVDSLVPLVLKRYPGVYWLDIPDRPEGETEYATDGVHPHSEGYRSWANAIYPKIVEILSSYGIKPKEL